jgi:hypothetical protein
MRFPYALVFERRQWIPLRGFEPEGTRIPVHKEDQFPLRQIYEAALTSVQG